MHYTDAGARKTPPQALMAMRGSARTLEQAGRILRSGGEEGLILRLKRDAPQRAER